MIIKVSYRQTPAINELEGVTKRDVITREDGAPNFCMRVFEVEPGSSTPSHAHPWEHEVFVLSGRGVVLGNQGTIHILKNSVVFIPPDEQHCFINTGSEPLQFICAIPLQPERQ